MSEAADKRALIVDDSAMTRRVIRLMLEELGYRVFEVGGVAETRAWMANAKRAPDIAVIDWGLPDGDGLEIIRDFRSDPQMRSAQLLMLTIRSEQSAIEAALEAGADEFLMKPCTVEALEDKLALLEFPRLPAPAEQPVGVGARNMRRVLIVDDSAVARRAIRMALEGRGDIEVVGTARNGREGVALVLELDPDVVILDLEMPELDGLEVLRELRERSPHTAVVVFSTHTERGAAVTITALLLGARDSLRKPKKMASFDASLSWMREELGRRIESITARGPAAAPRVLTPTPARVGQLAVDRGRGQALEPRPDLILIAASTGGPVALRELLAKLPVTLPVPVVIVQHLPEDFIEPFAAQLGKAVALPVQVAEPGQRPIASTIYLAPGGAHLSLTRAERGEICFAEDRSERVLGCRPAADVLFAAAAATYGRRCLALVLTGMGSDGCEGSRRLVAEGAAVFAQDQASSAVWSMPGAVVRAQLASRIVPLEAMAAEILAALGGAGD